MSSEDDSDSTKKDTQEEPVESDVLKDRLNTFKRVAIYALFLFVKISCFIFINANIIFFFTYLFDRIYYKKFTFGNSKTKQNMVNEFKAYLDEKFPTDRKKYPYAKGIYNAVTNNQLLTCPYDFKKNAAMDAAGTAGTAGTAGGFTCGDGAGKVPCGGTSPPPPPPGGTPPPPGGTPPPPGGGLLGAAAGVASGSPPGGGGLGTAAGVASGSPPGGPPPGGPPPGGVVGLLGAAAGSVGPVMTALPVAMIGGGEQKGGAVSKIVTNINNLSNKVLEGIKPITKVKKSIEELYKNGDTPGDIGDTGDTGDTGDIGDTGDTGDTGADSTSECKKDNFKPVDITTCESVNCTDQPHQFPFGFLGPDNFFGDYIRLRIACMGRTQIAINNKIKNTIKSFNNLLPSFCYCSADETRFLNGKTDAPTISEGLNPNQVYREDPEKIEIDCIVRNEFYNGIYMVFGLFISIFYLIYWDLYVNITLFINHILLFFEIKKSPETHIKTKYRRTLQFFILMMSPFIFITNRIIAFLIMVQITYKLWVQPLFEKKNKKRLSRILLENKTIIAFMFVFSYLLLLYTIELPPNYELPVKIIPTLVLTIIVIIKVIQAFYRIIKNLKFNPTTCKKTT